MEIFKDIPGYEGLYKIGSLGTIVSLKKTLADGRVRKERVLKTSINKDGYHVLTLSNYAKKNQHRRSVLIAQAFLGHDKSSGMVIDHINDVRDDDRVDNLQIVTKTFNSRKGAKGYSKKGKKWAVRVSGTRIALGSFNTKQEASLAYQNSIR